MGRELCEGMIIVMGVLMVVGNRDCEFSFRGMWVGVSDIRFFIVLGYLDF